MSKCRLKDSKNLRNSQKNGDVKRPDKDSTRGQASMLHPNDSNMIECDLLSGMDLRVKTFIAIVYPIVISIACITLHENCPDNDHLPL